MSSAVRLKHTGLKLLLLCCVGVSVVGLAGCASSYQAFESNDYDRRHPIKLAHEIKSIDIFVSGGQIDARQRDDLRAFIQSYATQNQGSAVQMAVPSDLNATDWLMEIRKAFSNSGVFANIQMVSYVGDPNLGASPIRLSYAKLGAQLTTACGSWPSDLGADITLESLSNKPYHNLGCAYQSMIVAQTADPIDLVRARSEGRIDMMKRTKGIENLRDGKDPSTQWTSNDASVSK